MQGPLAQLVAHLHDAQGVRGSSPLRPTEKVLLIHGGHLGPLQHVVQGEGDLEACTGVMHGATTIQDVYVGILGDAIAKSNGRITVSVLGNYHITR